MKIFAYSTLALATLALTACGNSTDPAQKNSNKTATPADTLTVVTPWEITNEDPSTSGFVYQRLGLAETLVDTDDMGNLIPALAEKWETTDGGKTWRFHLKDGVKFHDGTDLTADNVVQSIQIAIKKPTALESAKIQTIKAIDSKTVEFVLGEPLTTFPAYLAHSTAIILAKASFEGEKVAKIIGTGAYKADLIEPPQKLEQSAFADYWGTKAQISKITYLANSRSETRTLLAESSPNHLVYTLDAVSLKRLQDNAELQVATKTLARTIALKMDIKNPLFADKVVRQALSDAIDRTAIAKSVLRIGDAAAYEMIPPMFGGWQAGTAKTGTPDYTAIKQTLINQGFSEGTNGILQKDGKPFSFTLITFSDRPELPLIATALQDQWRKIGVDLQVSVANASEIPKAHQDGSLQMALYARNYGMVPDPLAAISEDLNPKGSDWGVMNYQNPTLTKLLTDIGATTDETKKSELKKQVATILVDERPLIPVVYYQQSAAISKNIQGLTLDPFERKYKLNELRW